MKKNGEKTCIFSPFLVNLWVRSYLMLQHQVTKIIRFDDRYDFTKGFCTTSYFIKLYGKYKPQNEKSSLIRMLCSSIKQRDTFRSSFARFCVSVLRSACSTCGRNKCHWRTVAIVERLNRYRGTSHKRSVGSSCIGLLSCMLGKPSQRYSRVATRSAWREVQNL